MTLSSRTDRCQALMCRRLFFSIYSPTFPIYFALISYRFSRRHLIDIRRPVHASKRSNEIAFDRTISDAPAKTETNKQTDRHAQSYTNVQKERDKEKHSSEQTQADRQEGMARCCVATDASVVWLYDLVDLLLTRQRSSDFSS